MKYYIKEGEATHGIGMYYLEVDWDKDLVVRQMVVSGDLFEWGRWTGSSLVGSISDQPPSSFDPPLVAGDEISTEQFNLVWDRVGQHHQ